MNILTLAAYERARRALRGECEPNSRAGKMRTNISNEPSANIVKMREVGSRPCRLRQNKKDRQKNGLFGRSGGTRTHGLQYPKLARYHLRYASICEKTIEFCCGQLCGQPRNLTDFSEWVKCEKSSVFKGFRHFCSGLVEQETTSTRNWRDTTFATPRNAFSVLYYDIISKRKSFVNSSSEN